MSYKYEFDSAIVGELRLSRADYQALHEGYELLRAELDSWNDCATEHGASNRPYEPEVADLARMIAWGKEELTNGRPEVAVKGVSIGTLRYASAALTIFIRKREEDFANRVRDGWPDGALKSLSDSLQRIRGIADSINYEPSDVLWQAIPKEVVVRTRESALTMDWDVFISHASEDKEAFVRPLADGLKSRGLKVWFDEFTLTIGDSLRRSIDRGLAHSRFGVVVISPDFLRKEWPQKELDGLVAREVGGTKVILPVWHNIGAEQIRAYSPTLSDRVAVSSTKGLQHVIDELISAIGISRTEAKPSDRHRTGQIAETRTVRIARADETADLWVNTEYPQKLGLIQRLGAEGYDLKWEGAIDEAISVDLEGWEHVTIDRPNGTRAKLKIRDAPVVGGYVVLLKRKKASKN
jgi:hypothetical protein